MVLQVTVQPFTKGKSARLETFSLSSLNLFFLIANFLFNIHRCRCRYEITVSSWDMMISHVANFDFIVDVLRSTVTVSSHIELKFWNNLLEIDYRSNSNFDFTTLFWAGSPPFLSLDLKLSESFPFSFCRARHRCSFLCWFTLLVKFAKKEGEKWNQWMHVEQFECAAAILKHLRGEGMDVSETRKRLSLHKKWSAAERRYLPKTFHFRKNIIICISITVVCAVLVQWVS